MKVIYAYDKDDHTAEASCPPKWHWCRIHWWPFFGESLAYPHEVNIRSSRDPSGWVHVHVYCGPGAYYPKSQKFIS